MNMAAKPEDRDEATAGCHQVAGAAAGPPSKPGCGTMITRQAVEPGRQSTPTIAGAVASRMAAQLVTCRPRRGRFDVPKMPSGVYETRAQTSEHRRVPEDRP